MKRNSAIGIIALLLMTGLQFLYAQPIPGPPGVGGPVPPAPGARTWDGLRGPGGEGLTSLTTVSGTVQQLTGNDESVLDGFTLGTGSSTVAVRFPAHMGQQVTNAVKTGSAVTVSGYMDTNPEGESIFHLVNLTAGKTTLTDTPSTPPAVLPTPALTTVKGKVSDFQLDRQGRTSGLVLSDQTLVKVPPHIAYQLVTMAPKGSTVSVDGYPRQPAEGQVMLKKRTIIEASQLTINGQTFLVR